MGENLKVALTKVLRKYGNQMQRMVAIEEMSELTKELVKWERGLNEVESIIEEIADVKLMLDQLIVMFDCEEQVEKWYHHKISKMVGSL